MSSGYVAGIKIRVGRKARKSPDHHFTKESVAVLRDHFADSMRRHGVSSPRARKPEFGKGEKGARRGKRKHHTWRPRFIVAYRRYGDLSRAAAAVGVSVKTVNAVLSREDTAFSQECRLALGEFVWRNMCALTRKSGARITLGRRQIEALVAFRQRMEAKQKTEEKL